MWKKRGWKQRLHREPHKEKTWGLKNDVVLSVVVEPQWPTSRGKCQLGGTGQTRGLIGGTPKKFLLTRKGLKLESLKTKTLQKPILKHGQKKRENLKKGKKEKKTGLRRA